jgi:hypothetical protein
VKKFLDIWKFSLKRECFNQNITVGIRFAVLRQQKSANMFLLIFADFAEIQQTANLLMKTLLKSEIKSILWSN